MVLVLVFGHLGKIFVLCDILPRFHQRCVIVFIDVKPGEEMLFNFSTDKQREKQSRFCQTASRYRWSMLTPFPAVYRRRHRSRLGLRSQSARGSPPRFDFALLAASSVGRPAYDSSAHKMIDVSFQFWHDIFVCTDETLCRFCVCGNARRRIRNSLGTATPSGVLSIYHDVPPERTTCHLGRQKEKARRHLAIALQLLRKCYLFPVPVMALRN